MVKAFYTAGMIYDILQTFGDLSEEAEQNRKYAKYKAAYIHNCLKNGETPIPGKMTIIAGDVNLASIYNENFQYFLLSGPHGEGGEGEAEGTTDDNADVVVGPGPGSGAAAPAPTPSNNSPPSSNNDSPPIGFVPHPTEINR